MRFYHSKMAYANSSRRDGNEAEVVFVQILSAGLGGLSHDHRAKSSLLH